MAGAKSLINEQLPTMSIVFYVFKCINLRKLNKNSGKLSVFSFFESPDLQSALLHLVFLYLLFCCSLPECQDVNYHYRLNRPFLQKRKPKGKMRGKILLYAPCEKR